MKTVLLYSMLSICLLFTQCTFKTDNGGDHIVDEDQKIIDDYIKLYNDNSSVGNSFLGDNLSYDKIIISDDTIMNYTTINFEEPIDLKEFKEHLNSEKKYDLIGSFLFASTRRNLDYTKAIINKRYNYFTRIHVYPNDQIVKFGYNSDEYSDIFFYTENHRESAVKEYLNYWVKSQNKNTPIDIDEYTTFMGLSLNNKEFICKYKIKTNRDYTTLKQLKDNLKEETCIKLRQPSGNIEFADILKKCNDYSIKFIYYNPDKSDSFSFDIYSFDI